MRIDFNFSAMTFLATDIETGITLQGDIVPVSPKRWFTRDPKETSFPGMSPYNSMGCNPVALVDPDGESTITANDGTVLIVYDDDDLGVYRTEHDKDFVGPISKSEGVKVGETKIWYEFRNIDNEGNVLPGVAEGAKILFNQKWDGLLKNFNKLAQEMSLSEMGRKSKNNQLFDIKVNAKYAPFGPYTGRLLNGKFASARSAGNYLAGLNAATCTQSICGINFYVDWQIAMRSGGAVHQKQWKGIQTVKDIVFEGVAFGHSPWFGEIEYCGIYYKQGFKSGEESITFRFPVVHIMAIDIENLLPESMLNTVDKYKYESKNPFNWTGR